MSKAPRATLTNDYWYPMIARQPRLARHPRSARQRLDGRGPGGAGFDGGDRSRPRHPVPHGPARRLPASRLGRTTRSRRPSEPALHRLEPADDGGADAAPDGAMPRRSCSSARRSSGSTRSAAAARSTARTTGGGALSLLYTRHAAAVSRRKTPMGQPTW